MRKPYLCALGLVCLQILIVGQSSAGGYLWLGSEFSGEGNIYRYSIATGMIDLVASPATPSGTHWNNMATHQGAVYLGIPTSQVMNRHDAYTGALLAPGTYSSPLAGHKEDGASHDGSLWRISFSDVMFLHRVATSAAVETTFTIASNPGFVGLEFVNGTPYVTLYNQRTIGTLQRQSPTAWTYSEIPWASGEQPPSQLGALAWDPEDQVLYVATQLSQLYRLTFSGGEAFSDLVVDLSTIGYPSGGLVDGMGWIPTEQSGVPGDRVPGGRLIELGNPWPNPARGAVWFDVTLAEATPVEVGIFDVSGRALRTWDLPGLGRGVSRFMWNFRGPDGQTVPSGRYFVRVTSAAGETTRPVTFVE